MDPAVTILVAVAAVLLVVVRSWGEPFDVFRMAPQRRWPRS